MMSIDVDASSNFRNQYIYNYDYWNKIFATFSFISHLKVIWIKYFYIVYNKNLTVNSYY